MRALVLSLLLVLASAAGVAPAPAVAGEAPEDRDEMSETDEAPEQVGTPLYFALEIRREGQLVARPQFLGEAGKVLRAERRQPGAAVPDYRLTISPFQQSERRFHLKLDVDVPPGRRGASQLQLDHGEVRKVELGPRKGDLEVQLLLMKVDSPEFRALMQLSKREAAARDPI